MAQFVAVAGNTSTVAATSPDGITWTARTLPSGTWLSVAWNGSVYVAVDYNSAQCATSPDGITWTSRALPVSIYASRAIAWNGSVFCLVCVGSTAAATSPDGITWTARTMLNARSWVSLAWNGTVFCALAQNSAVAATSPDGITWTERALPATASWSAIAWNDSTFVAVSSAASTAAATSPDGITWTARTLPAANSWVAVAWNGTTFCAVATNAAANQAATSPDGVTWTGQTLANDNLTSIAWNGATFCAVTLGVGSTNAYTSPDGVTWTLRSTSPAAAWWTAIAGVPLINLDSSGSSSITLASLNVTGTAITDTLGSSAATLGSILAVSDGYSGNSSSVTLPNILATGSALPGEVGESVVSLLGIQAVGSARADFIYPLSVTSGISFASPAVAAWAEFVTSVASMTTAAASPTIFWEVVTSSATITDVITDSRSIDAFVTATAVMDGTVVGSASYHVSAASLATIVSGIQFIQDFWDGWAYNLNTGAASTYEDFKFNSFARIGKNYYGCNSTGIHLLSGNTDAGTPINLTVTLGTSDLATDKVPGDALKSVQAVYVNARSDEPLVLTCRVEGQEYSYTFAVNKSPMAVSRVSPGKGLSGTLWQLELVNQLGSDAEIGGVEPLVTRKTRRV